MSLHDPRLDGIALRRSLKRGLARQAYAQAEECELTRVVKMARDLAPNPKSRDRLAIRLQALRGVVRVGLAGEEVVAVLRHRRQVTCDRGSEMACHPELARRLKIDIWFCDPHAPRPRGSNENTNGLLRQFFPKGTDLSGISQAKLNDVARLMNQRPRKTLGWKTPEEAMAEEIAAFRSAVALET